MAFTANALTAFAAEILLGVGMDAEKAATTARLLVHTDGIGRSTHGLAMLGLYVAEIERGGMRAQGSPHIVKDTGATAVWDGDYLPGLWLVNLAIDTAIACIKQHGVVSIAIRKAHHIGCLAALAKQAADKGYIATIANSDPSGKRVAPYGGKEALFTPNPFAFAYPGTPNSVLIDSCASITTTSMTRQKVAANEHFAEPWLLDAQGRPTRDPRVLEHSTPRGSLQLVGGQEYGHKGFGQALMIEALSQGLSGHGRKDGPTRWGGSVFLQVIDPAFFAGDEAFADQTQFFADACRSNPPIDPAKPVRLPGDNAARRLAASAAAGIELSKATRDGLDSLARKFKLPLLAEKS